MKRFQMKHVLATTIGVLLLCLISQPATSQIDKRVEDRAEERTEEGKVIEISEAEFAELIFDFYTDKSKWKYKGSLPAVVDFYATWCGPSRQLRPRLEALAKEYTGVIKVYSIDGDTAPNARSVMGVRAYPTIFFIPKQGTPTKSVGALPMGILRKQVEQILHTTEEKSKDE